MDANQLSAWAGFFSAAAGAAGTLAGLAFVAISINLVRIIELPGVAGRAGETIVLLSGALVGSLIVLMPGLDAASLGRALAWSAVPTWALPLLIQLRAWRLKTFYKPIHAVVRMLCSQLATLPALWAVLGLIGWGPAGVGCFAVSVILAMLVAILNAWVLLIEIVR